MSGGARMAILFGILVSGTTAGLMGDSGWFHGWWWNLVAGFIGLGSMLGFGWWIDCHDAAKWRSVSAAIRNAYNVNEDRETPEGPQ